MALRFRLWLLKRLNGSREQSQKRFLYILYTYIHYSIFSYCIYCVYLHIYFQLGCMYCAPWGTDLDTDCLQCILTARLRGQLSRLRKSWKCNSVTGSDRKHTDRRGSSLTHYCTVHLTDSRRTTVLPASLRQIYSLGKQRHSKAGGKKRKDTHIWRRTFICSRTGEGNKLMTALMYHKTANWQRDKETKKRQKVAVRIRRAMNSWLIALDSVVQHSMVLKQNS